MEHDAHGPRGHHATVELRSAPVDQDPNERGQRKEEVANETSLDRLSGPPASQGNISPPLFSPSLDADNEASLVHLPEPPAMSSPSFTWGERSGEDVLSVLERIYAEIVHWRGNIFTVPLGATGKRFVLETTRLVQAFSDGGALESVALLALMVMPALLLQAPCRSAPHEERIKCLGRRMDLWEGARFEDLLKEGRVLQGLLNVNPKRGKYKSDEDNITSLFASHMHQGKVKSALRLLSPTTHSGVLPLDEEIPGGGGLETVRQILKNKHPAPARIDPEALLPEPPGESHSVIFDRLDHNVVRTAALRCQGSAGPSGLDAACWRRLCTMYHGTSKALCMAIASMARRIATENINQQCLRPFTACRLIPLAKNPGVRPIGICETLRRIIGKAIMKIVGPDVQAIAETSQLCAGQKSGCEIAVHLMTRLYDGDIEGVLLVDASNAFNSLNRKVMLHNIMRLCPSFATCVLNCYRGDAELFVGGETLQSTEGTTQGDPLSMAIYALGTLPLIRKAAAAATQAWFADDASAGDRLVNLRSWFSVLCEHGPRYGYNVNAPKTWLVVKETSHSAAVALFKDTGINITTEGRPLLGAPIGTKDYASNFISKKVDEWKLEIEALAKIARVHPHPAYAAYTHGQANKWVYLSRVAKDPTGNFMKLEEVVRNRLIPSICDQQPSDVLREVFALPTRLGGLAMDNPADVAATLHELATSVTKPMVEHLLKENAKRTQDPRSFESALSNQMEAIKEGRKTWQQKMQLKAQSLKDRLPRDSLTSLALRWAEEKGTSTWLTALPYTCHGFDLTRREFLDALCLRYGWEPAKLPSSCVCGHRFSLEHALTCRKGGYVTMRHDEVRDLLASLLSETCHNVSCEPELQPLNETPLHTRGANRADGARLDIKAGAFWGRSRFEVTFFDVRVFNPYATSYRTTPPQTIFNNHDRQKRRQYEERVREVEGASFTPLVFSSTGATGRTSEVFLKRLASILSDKRNISYAEMMGWLRCRLAFALLRSNILCLRGTRGRGNSAIPHCPEVALAEARVQWQ